MSESEAEDSADQFLVCGAESSAVFLYFV